MILVTGGAGFIGSHLVEALAKKDAVRVLDNFSVGKQNMALLKEKGAEVIEGDIRDASAVEKAVRDCAVVFHLAAMNRAMRSINNPIEANAVNVDGTLNVLEACRKNDVKKMVFASSSSVYGSTEKLNSESQALHPLHPYGVGKMAGEEYCRVYHELYGLETVSLRYVSVFGPRQRGDIDYAAVIPKFITQILAGKPITIYGDGKQTRHFTYVKDCVEATLTASEKAEAIGQVFNIASEKETSVNDIASALEKITASKAKKEFLPPVKGEPKTNSIDTRKARKVLGFTAKHSTYDGLKEMVEWYKKKI